MPKITINHDEIAQKIFYTDNRVRNARPAYVFIHGAGGTHLHWPVELRRIEDAAAYTLDLPGHGKSDHPGHDKIEEYAAVVRAFVEAILAKDGSAERVILVGHSMGGAIVQTIALEPPEWLTGLVLIGTSARMRVSDQILDGLLTDFPKAVDFITKLCWSGSAVPAVRIALAAREMREILPEVVHGDFVACNQFDIRERVSEIAAPTLVLGASDDVMTPFKHNSSLAQQIPNAKLEKIDKSGHMMVLENPLDITTAIQKFAEQLSLA